MFGSCNREWSGAYYASTNILNPFAAFDIRSFGVIFSIDLAGYLYAWMSSEGALPTIQRYSYSAVVLEIDQFHLAEDIPVLDDKYIELMSEKIKKKKKLKAEAFDLEQQALKILMKK